MRLFAASFFACAGLLLPAADLSAQVFKIREVRVGFPHAKQDRFKVGFWAPVLIDLEVGNQTFSGKITVETDDSDGVGTRYTLGAKQPINVTPQSPIRMASIKIGSQFGEIRVHAEGKLGDVDVKDTYTYEPGQINPGLSPDTLLLLGIGQPQGLEPPRSTEREEGGLLGNQESSRYVANQTDVERLPDQWFGYEGVDVVVLPTGGLWDKSAAKTLVNDEVKRRALEEWVQMGGHLVVSVSSNKQFFQKGRPLEALLPADVTGAEIELEHPRGVEEWMRTKVQRVPNARVKLARLQPRYSYTIIASEPDPKSPDQSARWPVVVQGPYGLGRVTVVGLDTDDETFFRFWENRHAFWTTLVEDRPRVQAPESSLGGLPGATETDLAAGLCRQLEQFGGVPVIQFGWVALFILLYILAVGPIDYLVVKKLFKRPELTWITFPAVVVVVSLGAYFTASYLKGDELRVNKVDVIEVVWDTDRNTQQMYGSSWFTVFSPRFQHYDVGLQPAQEGTSLERLNVSWMGRPGGGSRGLQRGQRPSLFHQTYAYDAEQGEGQDLQVTLTDVPIQVWSVKTMTARWETPLDQPPFDKERTALRRKDRTIEGTITSQLPWKLRDCKLVYRDTYWNLGTLEPGQPKTLPATEQNLRQFLVNGPATDRRYHMLEEMMFYQKLAKIDPGRRSQSEYLDYLDQSWRLEYFTEAILIGWVDQPEAEGSRLNLQPPGDARMKQATLVRAFLPVREAKRP